MPLTIKQSKKGNSFLVVGEGHYAPWLTPDSCREILANIEQVEQFAATASNAKSNGNGTAVAPDVDARIKTLESGLSSMQAAVASLPNQIRSMLQPQERKAA